MDRYHVRHPPVERLLKRFLLLSPHFPPSSKIGAKRALNLVRHLPALGWEPVVLCCPARAGAETLGQQGLVPAELLVYPEFTSCLGRAVRGSGDAVEPLPDSHRPSSEATNPGAGILGAIRRSGITPIDQYVWDVPFVIGKAARIARREGVRAIVVNADPWSGLIAGVAVARRLDLPLIADLRDPWALHPRRQPLRPAITRGIVSLLESQLLRRADRIVLNTERCADAYRDHYAGRIDGERLCYIRNAFDASIFRPGAPAAGDGFSIHYFGKLRSGRDPSDFSLWAPTTSSRASWRGAAPA